MKRILAVALGCVLSFAAPLAAESDGPRSRALSLIRKLEADTKKTKLLSSTLEQAKLALVRADRARKAQDHKHGAALEALSLEWAEFAGELSRTYSAERAASELEKKRGELENKLDRTRMLIEQLNAQRSRTEAELLKLQTEAQTKTAPTTAAPAPKTAPAAAPKPSSPPKATGTPQSKVPSPEDGAARPSAPKVKP
jgi:Tfp pilus assembly protein FimV